MLSRVRARLYWPGHLLFFFTSSERYNQEPKYIALLLCFAFNRFVSIKLSTIYCVVWSCRKGKNIYMHQIVFHLMNATTNILNWHQFKCQHNKKLNVNLQGPSLHGFISGNFLILATVKSFPIVTGLHKKVSRYHQQKLHYSSTSTWQWNKSKLYNRMHLVEILFILAWQREIMTTNNIPSKKQNWFCKHENIQTFVWKRDIQHSWGIWASFHIFHAWDVDKGAQWRNPWEIGTGRGETSWVFCAWGTTGVGEDRLKFAYWCLLEIDDTLMG